MNPAISCRIASLLLLPVIFVAAACAAPPKITRLSVHGLQVGGTTAVTIQGSDLLPEPKLLLDLPIAEQRVVEKPTEKKVQFAVTLAADVTPGVCNLRLGNGRGISPPVIVAVDHLRQLPIADRVEELPVALSGELRGSNVHTASFDGEQGQEITIEVESQRIGAGLRPVLRLFDSKRRQIAGALPVTRLAGDTRLVTELPADDTYTVELNDLQYAAPAPGYYRLKIGSFQYADAVFPPAVERGKEATVELLGSFPHASRAQVPTGEGDRVPEGDSVPVSWPRESKPTGLRPRVIVSDLPELVEGESSGKPMLLPEIPSAVSGRLAVAGEEDVYSLQVQEGEKLRCEMFADRIGSPVDGSLELRNEKGGRLAQNDDAVGPDPRLDYTVPKNVSVVRIAVDDVLRRGGERCIYRLVVTRSGEAAQPDFSLSTTADTFNVPPQASRLFQLKVNRRGYEGPIRLSLAGLPKGIQADAVDVPSGGAGAIVSLRNTNRDTGADAPAPATVELRGESQDGDAGRVRVAHVEDHPLTRLQPWLARNMAVAQAEEQQAEFSVDWGKLAQDANLYQGIALTVPVTFKRSLREIGPIRLSLLTSQPVPVVNGKPAANQAIRGEKATLDIPVNPQAKAALDKLRAAEKALADARAKPPDEGEASAEMKKAIGDAQAKVDEAEKQLRAAVAKLPGTAEFKVIVPPDLPLIPYDLALKAELRSVDNKTVRAEVYTPVRRISAASPLAIALDSGPDFEAELDPKAGAALTFSGKIERKAGFAGDVTVTTAGQPRGISAPKTVVKADRSDFKLELKIPANFAGGEIDTIKLTATGPPDPKQANVKVQVEAPIRVKVTQAPGDNP